MKFFAWVILYVTNVFYIMYTNSNMYTRVFDMREIWPR